MSLNQVSTLFNASDHSRVNINISGEAGFRDHTIPIDWKTSDYSFCWVRQQQQQQQQANKGLLLNVLGHITNITNSHVRNLMSV